MSARPSSLARLPGALLRALLSRRAACLVMGAMAAILGVGSFAPSDLTLGGGGMDALHAQRPWLAAAAERLAPRALAAGPLFLALTAYLCAALLASIALRVRAFRRARRRGHVASERFRVERELVLPCGADRAAAAVAAAVRAHGFAPRAAADGRLAAGRGTPGFAGSIAFHAGLLLVVAGVAVSARTRVEGELLLAEDRPVPLEAASFLALSDATRLPAPGARIAIRDFAAEYSDAGTPVDFAALLGFEAPGGARDERLVRVNQGTSYAGFQFTLNRYGLAPELAAIDAQGRTRLDGVGLLRLLPPGREDALPLDGGGTLRVRLYPDHDVVGGRDVSRTLRPSRPVLHFAWVEADGRVAAEGDVAEGGAVAVAGRTIRFARLGYFGAFLMTRDPGVWLLVLGSLAGALGLALRFAFPDQSVHAEWEPCGAGTRVRLCASTRSFPLMYEQRVDRMVARVQTGGA